MLTYTTRNIRENVITGNAKTVTSVDRQNALVGHFDTQFFNHILHSLRLVYSIKYCSYFIF